MSEETEHIQGVRSVRVKNMEVEKPMDKVQKRAEKEGAVGVSVFLTRFKNYHLTMNADEDIIKDGRVVGKTKDKVIKFEGGRYTTSDEGEIEFIRGLRNFGREIIEAAPPKVEVREF